MYAHSLHTHTHSPHITTRTHHTHSPHITTHTQARVEHLLLQNKELLSHLQKLMIQLQQLQSLRLPAQPSSTSPPPPPATSTTVTSPPPPTSTNPTPEQPIDNAPMLDIVSRPLLESPHLPPATNTTASPVPPEATPVTSSDELRETPTVFTPPSGSPGNEEMGGTVDLVGPATNDPFTPIQLPVATS